MCKREETCQFHPKTQMYKQGYLNGSVYLVCPRCNHSICLVPATIPKNRKVQLTEVKEINCA